MFSFNPLRLAFHGRWPRRKSASPRMQMPGYTRAAFAKRRWTRPLLMTGLVLFTFIYSFLFILLPRQLQIPFSTPIVLLFLMIIWALPLSDAMPTPWIDRLFWFFFVTLLIWPNYISITIPGLPWITAARLSAAPLVVLILLQASRSRPFRSQMSKLVSGAPTIVKMVSAFAVIQVLSIALSSDPFGTANKVLNHQIAWTGMFFGSIWALRDKKRMDHFGLVSIFLVLCLCLIGIAEARVGHVLWSESIPGFLSIDEEYAEQIFAGFYRLNGAYRVIATSTTPLSFGELLAVMVPFIIYSVDRKPTWRSILIALVLEGLVVNALIAADARLGFAGFVVAHAVYLILFTISYQRSRPHSLVAPTLTVALPAILATTAVAILLIGRIRKRVLGGGVHQFSDDARLQQIRGGMKKIWESPVFGFGADRGGAALGFYTPGGRLTIDNYYLSILLDYGFVGFFVFYGMIIAAIWKAASIARVRRDRIGQLAAAFASMITAYFVIKSVLSQEANQSLLFIGLGAVVVLSYLDKHDRPELLAAREVTAAGVFR